MTCKNIEAAVGLIDFFQFSSTPSAELWWLVAWVNANTKQKKSKYKYEEEEASDVGSSKLKWFQLTECGIDARGRLNNIHTN